MAESFITALNGVITGKHYGDINADFYGTPYYGNERIEVPFSAAITPMEPITFYTSDWTRKSDCCLIREGLLPMPEGYVEEGDKLRPMTQEERIIAGFDDPPVGYKIKGGKLVPMSMAEQVAAGQMTKVEYDQHMEEEATAELQRRLGDLQTPEVLAQAEIDADYAAERKAKLAALLAVKQQPKWPVTVKWPE